MITKRKYHQPYRHWSLISVVLSLSFVNLNAVEYDVDRDQKNSVKFISDAPIEDFEGVTESIDGYVLWEGDSLKVDADYSNSEFYFEVDLESLDTGIGLRNRHMRENYLETDEYRYASYKGKLTNVAMNPDSLYAYSIISEGIFSVHGVDKNIKVMSKVYMADSGYKVTSEFEIKLSDYDIEIPSLMFMKIDETIQIFLDFHLKKIEK